MSDVGADGSKIGRITLAQMTPTEHVTMLITDDGADRDELERIRARGVTIIIA